ncbi:MAG: MFS transporter [Candidatus Lokiarchaeota archaeon]|nr:MFS transporter [Candidatus Lokiarchaeota archaeon]
MSKQKVNETSISIFKNFWPLYLLNGFQHISFGGIIVLVVPLSLLMWPNEPYHAVEIGMMITLLFWSDSLAGLIFGRFIDQYSRKTIILIISVVRAVSMIMLGFAIVGRGLETWGYFTIFVVIFGVFAGGAWPAVVSISDDAIPRHQRSRFFGYYQIVRTIATMLGFLVASYLVQQGFWRLFFWGIGLSILIMGIIFFLSINEPKRGAQREELMDILKDDEVKYEFQVDKTTMRKTMFSKTNRVALVEGIFTMILMGSLTSLILPYIQSPPHNIAPFSTSIFLVIFGLTGGLLGTVILARLCDKLAQDHPIRRVPMIILSIVAGLSAYALIFLLPLPHLTPEEGENIPLLMSFPVIWLMGVLYFMSRSIFSLYIVNQAPILQEINLPESQGQIVSWNQFLESLGRGIAPLIAGVLLIASSYNYQFVVMIIIFCILPGIILWSLSLRWFSDDVQSVREILEERAKKLRKENGVDVTQGNLIKS